MWGCCSLSECTGHGNKLLLLRTGLMGSMAVCKSRAEMGWSLSMGWMYRRASYLLEGGKRGSCGGCIGGWRGRVGRTRCARCLGRGIGCTLVVVVKIWTARTLRAQLPGWLSMWELRHYEEGDLWIEWTWNCWTCRIMGAKGRRRGVQAPETWRGGYAFLRPGMRGLRRTRI